MMEMLGDEYSHKALLNFPTAPVMFPAKLSSAAEAGARVAGGAQSHAAPGDQPRDTDVSVTRVVASAWSRDTAASPQLQSRV